MTLRQTIELLESVAMKQPSVNMVVRNDIFRLNGYADARYGAFGWTQGRHSASTDGNVITYNFTLFYIDRLTADQGNQLEVQSVGMATLDNILKTIYENGVDVGDYTFTTFNQRFLDECAGVYCQVGLSVPVFSMCGEVFGADYGKGMPRSLSQAIRMMELVASRQPSINMVVENDIFRLNTFADARYGVFGWTQGQHSSSVEDNVIDYEFTLFYIDRLTAGQGNQVEIQSVGMDSLGNILKSLHDMGWGVADHTFTTFNQRFMDECAGVFCNVTLSLPMSSICGERYGDGDFNDDFNDDFLIF